MSSTNLVSSISIGDFRTQAITPNALPKKSESILPKIFKDITSERGGISSTVKVTGGFLEVAKVTKVASVFTTTAKVFTLFSLAENLWWFGRIATDAQYYQKEATPANVVKKSAQAGAWTLNSLVWFEGLGASLKLSQRTVTLGKVAISSAKFSAHILLIAALSISVIMQLKKIFEMADNHQRAPGDPFDERKYSLEMKKELAELAVTVAALALVIASFALLLTGGGAVLVLALTIVSPGLSLCSIAYKDFIDGDLGENESRRKIAKEQNTIELVGGLGIYKRDWTDDAAGKEQFEKVGKESAEEAGKEAPELATHANWGAGGEKGGS